MHCSIQWIYCGKNHPILKQQVITFCIFLYSKVTGAGKKNPFSSFISEEATEGSVSANRKHSNLQ